jgi:D-alanyl-D-alanine carboxypeptidase/D-alanyl-D-alanine-endopeptidase (penicillin-binding protein 4)
LRPRARRTIIALCAAFFLAAAANATAASGDAVGPSGQSGTTGTTATTGASGATGVTGVPINASALAKLDAKLSAAMKPLGPHSGAYVVDLATGQTLFDDNGLIARYPASVEKLYTLTTALAQFGLDGTLQTSVYGVGSQTSDGVWHGDLYLRGGGDPTFGDAKFIAANYAAGTSVGALAGQLIAATHITRVDGAIIGDESYFDSRRGGPATGYRPDPNLVGKLSALAFDRGETHSFRSPAGYAAYRLTGALKRRGIVVTGTPHAGTTPLLQAQLLTSIASPPMSTLSVLTALPSDDFFAEMILKALGARFGSGGTTSAGAAVVKRFLATTLSIHPQIADGSGLSRSDLTSPVEVVALLRDLSPGGTAALQSVGSALRASLPVVGRSGTLVTRMLGTPAAGRCIAKSGTLSNASDLAGWCDGRFVFAFLMNDVDVTAAQKAQDAMTEPLAALAAPANDAQAHPSKRASRPSSSSTVTPSRSAFASFEPAESPATR